MKKLKNILVPVDFSPMSAGAIAEAKNLALPFGAAVHLAHIYSPEYPVTFMGPIFARGQTGVSFGEHRRKGLEEDLAEVARKNGLPRANLHLAEGSSVYREICRLAQTIPADLIVMPTHGRKGLPHAFFGSTAERVVQHAPAPVLVTRPSRKKASLGADGSGPGPALTILVPIDFSPGSAAALRAAVDLAGSISARLLILHAVHLGDELGNEGLGIKRLSGLREEARAQAATQMMTFLGQVEFGRVPFETILRTGNPVTEICAEATRRGVDLIVTATHGRTGVSHLLIGSVAEQVVRRAQQSVLVIPSHPARRLETIGELVRQGNREKNFRRQRAAFSRARPPKGTARLSPARKEAGE